jgi:glycosyltransferase involved in cell wall biosynthesis
VRNSAVLVAPDGDGSLAGYAAALSAALEAEPVVVEGCSGFGRPLFSRRSLSHLACEGRVVRMLRGLDAPLLHFTSHHLARFGPLVGTPYVVTVHDLMRHRDCTDRRGRAPLIHRPSLRDRLHVRLDAAGLRRAIALIAVSQHTKRELVELLGVPPERVHVVPEGVNCAAFGPVPRRLLAEPYVLYVGSEQPRKNLPTLFQAFARVRHAMPGLRLVKVGAPGGPEAPFREMTRTAARDAAVLRELVFANRVSHDELVAWYSGALCLVQPSRHEGFGLTPLEAMACGCPVIASAGGALPELVCGAGVVYGQPDDVDALAWELTRLLASRAERAALAEAGRQRAAGMPWELAAKRTRRVWGRALDGRPLASTPPFRSDSPQLRRRDAARSARLVSAGRPGSRRR